MNIRLIPLLSLLIFILVACGTTDKDASEVEAGTQKDGGDERRIAFFSSGSNTTYEQVAFEQAKETAEQLGVELDVFDAGYDALEQLGQIENAITANKYDGFVVQANDGDQLCKIITQNAAEKKIAISAINIELCGEHDMAAENTLTFIGGQGAGVYQEIIQDIFKDNPDGGKIAAIGGPATGANYLNLETALEIEMEKNPNWELVGIHATDYTANQANQLTQNILQANEDLDVILSNYSGMTVGVVKGKNAMKRDNLKIYDFGGDKWAFDAVKSGDIEQTAIMLPRREIELGIETLNNHFNGEEVEEFYDLTKEDTLPGTPFVNKDNIEEFESLGFPEY